MGRYRVKVGMHAHSDGKIYKAGQTVVSDDNLAVAFRDKFEVVHDEPQSNSSLRGGVGSPQPTPPPTSVPAAAPLKISKTPVVKTEEKSEGKPKGVEVTSKFPEAKEQDYKVFKFRGAYSIYDADDLSKPLNERPVGKDEVDAVIKEALEHG